MTRRFDSLKTAPLVITLLFGFALRGSAQSTEGYTDILYDEFLDEMRAFATTYPDYGTLYYYEPRVHVWFMKQHDYYPYNVWLGEQTIVGETHGGYGYGYVLASVSAPLEPGVPYSAFAEHSVDVYYYEEVGSYWNDFHGYSMLSGSCEECHWDPERGMYVCNVCEYRTWTPPQVFVAVYVATVLLGDTGKEDFVPPPPTLVCNPSPVTRGSNVYCEVFGAAATRVTHWSFSGDNDSGNVSGPSGVKNWSGTMVQSGTVSVTLSGLPSPTPVHITVNNRSWGSQVVPADSVPNGTFATLPTPPYEASGTLGQYMWQHYRNVPNPTQVPGGGPNSGFYYFASPLSLDQFYMYEVNPDLTNAQSAFAQHQFGNCGVISRPSLENNVVEHESSSQSGVHSHYNRYEAFLTSQDRDPNVFVEQRVARPGSSSTQFRSQTDDYVRDLLFFIGQDTALETGLYAANQNQTTGLPMGNINWPPYPYTCP